MKLLRKTIVPVLAAAALAAVGAACTNDPYPDEDRDRKILYTTFSEAPRTLDPAVAYTTSAHAITGNVYDTLLEYHYLKRPYELIPGLAEAVPEPEPRPEGRVAYRFRLRPDLRYQEDACFALSSEGRRTRRIVAADVAFELMRVADPAVTSPVVQSLSAIVGLRAFGQTLAERREADAEFAALPVHEQYAEVGGIDGVRVEGDRDLEIVLSGPNPQILYWFAMPFTAPVPWEALAYYDGQEGRDAFDDHPVGSGPFRLTHYAKHSRIVLERNPQWYGIRHPEWEAPGGTYPSQGEAGDAEAGLLDPAGQPLPFLERIEFRREKEAIPLFNKFLQGYYDMSGVTKESFDRVIQDDRLSPDMAARGMALEKAVEPSVFYVGFNMEDPVVGEAGGTRSRKLRQAMSLAVDTEEFLRRFTNGRGVPAHSPLPPGLFGHDPEYRNPYRQVDLERARALLREAGYPGGVDPETGRPLRLSFDTYQLNAQSLLRLQFFVDAWRRIGVDVEIDATSYNQFQAKVRRGAYQIFFWGWIADYPDPENFLFLLWSEMARSKGGGPNTANFSNERYDELYRAMKVRANDAQRRARIREMVEILERERPWIELFHNESYVLHHGWLENVKPFGMSYPMAKYRDLRVEERTALRARWNEPVMWPAYALVALGVAIVIPGVVTFYRERQ